MILVGFCSLAGPARRAGQGHCVANALNDPKATPDIVACGYLPEPEQGKARLNS